LIFGRRQRLKRGRCRASTVRAARLAALAACVRRKPRQLPSVRPTDRLSVSESTLRSVARHDSSIARTCFSLSRI